MMVIVEGKDEVLNSSCYHIVKKINRMSSIANSYNNLLSNPKLTGMYIWTEIHKPVNTYTY